MHHFSHLQLLRLSKMTSQVAENFTKYFENWMIQLEELLKQLVIVPRETSYVNDHELLVSKMTTHHKNYYTAKWAAAHEDILAFFTPMWLSPLEIVYSWITGWKPSMAFRLVSGGGGAFSDEELKNIDGLRVKIRGEEEKVEREMERQQVAIGDRKMVELARIKNENDELVELALKGLRMSLERVMKMADCVRLKTLKGLLEILSPLQSVDFLAAISTIQIQMRKRGRKRINVD
ncbi:protein DOG1-like 4 [Solanum pennellii]|uniref:Protein DOG1-like 4 n=1 Tax=Solanum pennellii TaxID=28526 RepID=A0ABM1G106_SOLPN|nr:protein DOG1-like 4 [Solanum pennellii]